MAVTLGPAVRARLPLPDTIERGTANTLRCPLYDASGVVAPTSGTITITDAGGTVQVSAASVTITSNVATYSWTPGATLTLGDGWVVEWSLVTTAYGTLAIRNGAMLCRVRLTCPITVDDLYALEPSLSPAGSDPITAMTAADFDARLEEGWTQVQSRLLAMGKRPYLAVGAHALREVTQRTALAVVFRGLSTRLASAYTEMADRYHDMAEQAWTRVRLTYDETDDGKPDVGRKAARPAAIWIGR